MATEERKDSTTTSTDMVLSMVTSSDDSNSEAGAILLGNLCTLNKYTNEVIPMSSSLSHHSLISVGVGAKTVPDSEPVGRELVNPHAVRRHDDPMDLVELAHTVQQADKFVRATTGGKLQVIVEQIRFLQIQVREQKLLILMSS